MLEDRPAWYTSNCGEMVAALYWWWFARADVAARPQYALPPKIDLNPPISDDSISCKLCLPGFLKTRPHFNHSVQILELIYLVQGYFVEAVSS